MLSKFSTPARLRRFIAESYKLKAYSSKFKAAAAQVTKTVKLHPQLPNLSKLRIVPPRLPNLSKAMILPQVPLLLAHGKLIMAQVRLLRSGLTEAEVMMVIHFP